MKLHKIFVEREIAEHHQVAEICDNIDAPVRVVDTLKEAYAYVSKGNDPVSRGKQTLILCQNKGAFIKACPGTREYNCCSYEILHMASFCNMDCAYCILQTYFHPPVLQYFVNQEDMWNELEQVFMRDRISRVGTGEYTDSLIWENYSDLTRKLIQRFSSQTRAILELKTKTVAVDRLKGLDHNRKTILAWSLNTEKVIQLEERYTTTLAARLKAARRCVDWGYPVAFHFDPMVIYEGCESDYNAVIQQLFTQVPPENIVWISLGTFRFIPALKQLIQARFPASGIVYHEFVPGLDGKMRYFKPLRMNIYKKIAEWIRAVAPDVCLYFCMEDDEVWETCLGYAPSEAGGLPEMLDAAAAAHCGLTAPVRSSEGEKVS
ncbi:MAG: DNA photolyase [Deltaproteobacteria bacterium]|nr:MAG: DNA photolyase [Deltaproteobacteria bacterium]